MQYVHLLYSSVHLYFGNAASYPSHQDHRLLSCSNVASQHLFACSFYGQAAALYKATGAHGRLAAALFADDDWAGLVQLSAELPQGDPLLLRVGAWLQSAGLAPEAAAAFARARLRA